MLCLDVDLSIRLQYVTFRLIPLFLPSTSSMKFLRMKESSAMNSTHPIGEIHLPFKAKTAAHVKKLRRKVKGHKGKTKQPREIRPPWSNRGGLCPSCPLRSSYAAFCSCLEPQIFALDRPYWAFWACFANYID